MPDRTRFAALAAATLVVALSVASSAVLANDSPHGDSAGAWPNAWRTYLLKSGAGVHDVNGDVGCGSGYCDVSSGSGAAQSVYFAYDGTNVFFRIRVKTDPRSSSHGGFLSTAYVIQIAVNKVAVAAVGLDGKSAHRDFVYVSNADGSSYTEVYAYPFNNLGGEKSAGARALAAGGGEYFVDFQMPLWRITSRSGGKVTATTPIQLFFGTSQAANLSVINKDYMVSSGVDFGQTSTVTFANPPAPTPAPSAPPASGTAPPHASQPPSGDPASPSFPPTLPNTASQPGHANPLGPMAAPILISAIGVLVARRRLGSARA
jgi:hypothetical protein